MPPVLGHSVTRGVIAGEACTELGCEASPAGDRSSWLARWFGIGRDSGREFERKDHGTQP